MQELFQDVFAFQTCKKIPPLIPITQFKVLTLYKKQKKHGPLGPLLFADPDIFLKNTKNVKVSTIKL